MSRLGADIDYAVAAMVTTPWPTTAAEHAVWAAAVGLPSAGEADDRMDEWSPGSAHFAAPGHPWRLSWHFFCHEFTGISMFHGEDLSPDALRDLGHELRDRFDARWAAAERLEARPPLTGFTSNWLPGECLVDLYWHAPQVDPRGWAHRGAVQLAVTHHARAQAEDREHAARRGDGTVTQPEAALNDEEEREC